jgi:FkbM family methyltransferase
MNIIKKSLQFDIAFLGIDNLSLASKVLFLVQKYLSLCLILLNSSAKLKLKKQTFFVESISDVGTLQASICDVYEELYKSKILSNNIVVIDIGANIGQFASAIKFVYPDASVFSFEPDKNVYKNLRANVVDLDNVTPYNFGIGAGESVQDFYISNLSLESTFETPSVESMHNYKMEKLEVRTLDSIDELKTLKEIDLLKIDVEGFESDVLDGATQIIKKSKYILIEVSLGRDTKVSNIDLLGKVKQICPSARIKRIGRPLGDEATQVCTDFLIKLI